MNDQRRGWLPYVVIGGLLLVIVVFAGRPRSTGPPLDPRSDSPDGTSALLALGRSLGADVRISGGLPRADDEVLLVLRDTFDDSTARVASRWVMRGGTLVLNAPFGKAFSGGSGSLAEHLPRFRAEDFVAGSLDSNACDVTALATVRSIDVGAAGADGVFSSAAVMRVEPGDKRCFGNETGAFVVARPHGAGWVVGLGGIEPLVNRSLGKADNAALAAALVAPHPGARVAVADPIASIGSGGGRKLIDVIAPGVKRALIEASVAFVLYALYRARRLGRLVREPQPTQIAGSELTVAVGDLLSQARNPTAAAQVLRRDLRRTVRDRLGVPTDAPPESAAEAVASRTGIDVAQVLVAVGDNAVASDAALVDVARTIESVRKEVTG
jgi:hypothetical protein